MTAPDSVAEPDRHARLLNERSSPLRHLCAVRICPVGDRAHPRPAEPLGRAPAGLHRCAGSRSARLNGAPVDVEALGARMRLYPYNNVCEKQVLFTPQFFDPRGTRLLESRASATGFTFVDIGANVGAYSLFVAAQAGRRRGSWRSSRSRTIFDRLTYNIRQNPFGTIKAVACAVADKAGRADAVSSIRATKASRASRSSARARPDRSGCPP